MTTTTLPSIFGQLMYSYSTDIIYPRVVPLLNVIHIWNEETVSYF